jgi:hypothetical protein
MVKQDVWQNGPEFGVSPILQHIIPFLPAYPISGRYDQRMICAYIEMSQ